MKQAANGRKGHLWRRVLQAAERDLEKPPLVPDPNEEWAANELCAMARERLVRSCSFAYLMTGRTEFLERARREVEADLACESWIDPSKPSSSRQKYGLMTGSIAATLAYYLDWCGSGLEGDEIARVVEHFRAKAAEPLLADMDKPIPFHHNTVNNHVSWRVAGSALMSLLLAGDDPFYGDLLKRCVFHLRRYLDWINQDGSTDEGGRYWMHGMMPAAVLMDALRVNADRLGADLKEDGAARLCRNAHAGAKSGWLEQTAYFPLYGIQGTQHVVDFGDTPIMDAGPMAPLFYWFARIWRNGHFQWAAQRLKDDNPLGLIWCDPGVEEKPPTDIPASRHFSGAGWGILRSDLESSDGFLLAVRAGHNAMSHRHLDLGTFILRAGGRGLIIDSGLPTYSAAYWTGQRNYKRESIGHNVILVDGMGQKTGSQNHAQITRLQDHGNEKYLDVDVHCPATGIALHRRQIVVSLSSRLAGKLTLDEEVRLSRRAKVSWLFHFDEEAHVDRSGFGIRSGPAALRMNVDSPGAVRISVERDHPVPLVRVDTVSAAERHTLKLTGDFSSGENSS